MITTDDQHRVDPATGAPAPATGSASAARTRVKRQLPTVRDLAPLMQFKKPSLPGRRQRLEQALTIWDLRDIAAAAPPKAAFDYNRGRGRGGDLPRPRTAGVRGHRVHPGDPAGRVAGGHLAPGARGAGVVPVRHRADGLHADDADRGRAGRRPGRRTCRHPVLALHDGHHRDRGRPRRQPARAQLVPAVHVEGPREVDGAGLPRPAGRLRHPARHRGRARRGCAAAGQAERVLDPAAAERLGPW